MAMPFATPYSPIKEDANADDDFGGGGGGGCFQRFCFGRDGGGSHRYLLHERGGEETWVVAQIKKLKQLSELVAGPKWKNFVRKMGRLCRCKKQAAPPFQYSPESYALNFAGGEDEEEVSNLSHSFSARFVARV